MIYMNKKIFVGIIVMLIAFTIGFTNGYYWNHKKLNIQEELSVVNKKLEQHYTGTQTEMTMLSNIQLSIALMELEHLCYTISNQQNYQNIEKTFCKETKEWKEYFEKEQNKSLDSSSGSIGAMEHNLYLLGIVKKHINNLKNKWCLI